MHLFLPMRGRTAASCSKLPSKVIRPNRSWKNTADIPTVATARAIAAAIGTPSMPQRVDSDASATATTVGVAGLLELADDQRAEVGQRRLRPVDRRHPVARLPVAQADEVEAGAVEHAAVLADRELAHPLQDEQLDLGDLRQVDERRRPSCRGSPRDPHGIGTRSMMSSITASVGQAVARGVRAEPDAVAEDVRRQILDVFRDRPRSRCAARAAPTPWPAGPSR